MSFGIVYKVTNIVNKKVYIGQTILGLNRRRRLHENSKVGWYFNKALAKYGKNNFRWKVLEHCYSKEEMDEMEFHYIKQYNSFGIGGYNLTLGGDGVIGFSHSEEHKNRISNLYKGKKFSAETLLKMSDSHLGHKHSKESKQKISNSRKGIQFSEEHKYKIGMAHRGIKRPPFTADALKNMSKAKKGKPNFKNRKKYIIVFPDSKEYVVRGLNLFCKAYVYKYGVKLWPKFFTDCAKDRIKDYKGFKCRYYNNECDMPVWEG